MIYEMPISLKIQKEGKSKRKSISYITSFSIHASISSANHNKRPSCHLNSPKQNPMGQCSTAAASEIIGLDGYELSSFPSNFRNIQREIPHLRCFKDHKEHIHEIE